MSTRPDPRPKSEKTPPREQKRPPVGDPPPDEEVRLPPDPDQRPSPGQPGPRERKQRTTRRSHRTGACLPIAVLCCALVGATLACDSPTSDERLQAASEDLADARDDSVEARERLESARKREAMASENLQEARRGLREAEATVLSAKQRVERRATDEALFRSVQSAVLELDRSAVEVRVDDAVVTLTGTVADASTRERAVELARSTAGVREVRDQLEVEAATPPDA